MTGASLAMPWIIPASALGKDGAVAPSNRLGLGVIGLGNRNTSNLGHFLKQEDVRVLTV